MATKRDKKADSAKKGSRGSRSAWRVMDRSSTLVGGLVAREAALVVWKAATGRRAPAAGRHPEVATKEAVAWAVVGGATVELVKLGVRRWAATYWVRSTGSLPPGMKSLGTPVLPEETKEPAPSREPAPNLRRKRRR